MVEAQAVTGEDLRVEDVWAVAIEGAPTELSDGARERMRAAREIVDRAVASPSRTYGVNTGFGRLVTKTIPPEHAEELQVRLLRSHACGVGEPYPDEIVRAALLLRANALATGHSGTRVEVAELLLECLARGILPRVPSRGSVGASGDLAPLAHLALPLIGEGEAWFEGELLGGGEALARAGLEPLRLRAKEGLSLINGTQFMAAFCALGRGEGEAPRCGRRHRLRALARGLAGIAVAFSPAVQALRPLRGQAESAENVMRLLEGSAIMDSHRWCDRVQDAYSLRCAPQVHGASRDLLRYIEETVARRAQCCDRQPARAPR